MLTAEERVRLIRAAVDRGDRQTADRHFAMLLRGSARSTERWLRHVITVTPVLHDSAEAASVSEDLRQELALDLWRQIAIQHGPAWEHTYWRALLFAQHHAATRYMRGAGYWVAESAMRRGHRGVASLVSTIDQIEEMEAPNALLTTEVGNDIRAAVMRLPPRERAAVVLRFWHGMGYLAIADRMNCSDRTVRTLLRHAAGHLGAWYEGNAWSPRAIE